MNYDLSDMDTEQHYYDPAWERLFARELRGVVTCSEPARVMGELYSLTWCPTLYRASDCPVDVPGYAKVPDWRVHAARRDRITAADAEEASHRHGRLYIVCTARGTHERTQLMAGEWAEAERAPKSYLRVLHLQIGLRPQKQVAGGQSEHAPVRRVLSDRGIIDRSLRVRFLPHIREVEGVEVKHTRPGRSLDTWERSKSFWDGIEYQGFEFTCPKCGPRYTAKFSPAHVAKLILQQQFLNDTDRGAVTLDISIPTDIEIYPDLRERLDRMTSPEHPYQHHGGIDWEIVY